MRGYCECGCGQRTKLAPFTRKDRGWVAGQPMRFAHGHRIARPFVDNRGYTRVKIGGRWMPEHIHVVEQALVRKRPRGAVVHHVNGVKTDNRPENLVLCESHAYHNLLHARQRALDATGDANALPCRICGSYEDQGDLYVHPRRRKAHHRRCAREQQAARAQATRTGPSGLPEV
jgi:hypothetical protein